MIDLLRLLHNERATLAKRVARLDAAIKILDGTRTLVKRAPVKRKRKMSAEARAKISAAAKKRWAKVKR
jgi:hypothetical protein